MRGVLFSGHSSHSFRQSDDGSRSPNVRVESDANRLDGCADPIGESDVGVPSDDQLSINFSDPSNHVKEEAKHDAVVLAVETKDESEPTESFTHGSVNDT
jgi:hypothetical protein